MKWIAVALAAAAAAGLFWGVGELHYRNCVNAAKAIPDTRSEFERSLQDTTGQNSYATALKRRIAGCSRLP